MRYLRLGASGLKVSAIGLGANAFGGRATPEASHEVIRTALDLGINLIDTANVYTAGQSERIIGEAIASRRDEVVLATKAGMRAGDGPLDRGSSRLHLMRELERSLTRLRTDHVDLYQIHRFDDETPLEETLRTVDDMVRSGKVRYLGASNYAAWQLMKALGLCDRLGLERLVSVQPSYSLAGRRVEEELVPCCLDQGVGIIAYFPLAGGLLSGKYVRGQAVPKGSRADTTPAFGERMLGSEARLALAEGVAAIARDLGATPAQVALAWLVHMPAVASAIAGATRADQVRENAAAADLTLEPAVMERLDQLSRPFASVSF
jgi:aryl-alcohol dehydrogenase-like predicted oxidoreductase